MHEVYLSDGVYGPCWLNDWCYCQDCENGVPLPEDDYTDEQDEEAQNGTPV